MNVLRNFFRRLGRNPLTLQVVGASAENHERNYWLLAHAGMPRY